MSKCAYCLKTEDKTTFKGREHIIPQFLGKFDSENPTIKGDLICDRCNNEVFSKLETNFKEDSYEGVFGQMLNLEGHSSIRLRGKNVKIKLEWNMEDEFFNGIFPFLKVENNELRAYPQAQIQIKNFDGVYQIFLADALEKIKENPRKFAETKEKIKKLKNEDIHIFAGGEKLEDKYELDKTIDLLKDFGKNYNEKSRKFSRIEQNPEKKIRFDMDLCVDRDLGRVLAKICFNYFLFCLKKSELEHIAYREEFNNIRGFVMGENSLELKDVVRSSKRECILFDEKIKDKRLVAHIIVFQIIDSKIVANLTLFGKNVYDILIGNAPAELIKDNFGCGHAFNPFSKQIANLKQEPKPSPTPEDLKISFGVFNRT